ncbi:class I tRNA ligase family protein [Sphingomonas sp. MMS24-JH45]
MGEPFYITTAISYPNGRPHIGHADEAIAAHAIARFQRQAGRDARFQTGTDEHGLKDGPDRPRPGAGRARSRRGDVAPVQGDVLDALGISYDRFIRTTDTDHYAASAAIWKAMEAAVTCISRDTRAGSGP